MRGAFIVIEGLDRSGKSTQATLLNEHLQSSNTPVRLIKFPDRTTPIGQIIDAYLRSESELDDRAIHLLFSANRWELASSIEQTLNAGTTVLCDRYAFSGTAFSAAKGLPFNWCRTPDISLPAPDLTIFLDISPEIAKQRGGYGEERYEKEALQRRVREMFARIANEVGSSEWVRVDAGRDVETVAREIRINIEKVVGHVEFPTGKLWQNLSLGL